MAASDIALKKGCPPTSTPKNSCWVRSFSTTATSSRSPGLLDVEDFSLEKHRRIFLRMRDLADRGERIDRVTVANELMKQNQLESVDGLSYLVSLDDGLPQIFALDSYVRIVKDKSTLRRIVFASQKLIDRCIIGQEEPEEILAGAEETLLKLGETPRSVTRLSTPSRSLAISKAASTSFSTPASASRGSAPAFTSSTK